jgi:uncharacterized protein (DUF1697 family)
MTKYIAFLRAINVGSHIVKMPQLKKLFEDLGFDEVSTFIASGNVVFEAEKQDVDKLERRIENHLEKELGYEVITFVRTAGELAKIAAAKPFGEPAEDEVVYVAFLSKTPDAAAKKRLDALCNEVDTVKVVKREAYWRRRVNAGESAVNSPAFEKALGMKATVRNISTAKRLAAKFC